LHNQFAVPRFSSTPHRWRQAGAGALSPQNGGALPKQSTQRRRLVVAAVLCGGLFGVPLLVLQNTPAHASHVTSADSVVVKDGGSSLSRLDDVVLPSHLVAYEEPVPQAVASPAPIAAVTTSEPAAAAPHVEVATPPTTPVVHTVIGTAERGQATWYGEAPAGKCASPTLPFGTVLTVTNIATGASTVCTVDDREESGYPRVVDMSYSGFSQIANPSQGVVDVTISW